LQRSNFPQKALYTVHEPLCIVKHLPSLAFTDVRLIGVVCTSSI